MPNLSFLLLIFGMSGSLYLPFPLSGIVLPHIFTFVPLSPNFPKSHWKCSSLILSKISTFSPETYLLLCITFLLSPHDSLFTYCRKQPLKWPPMIPTLCPCVTSSPLNVGSAYWLTSNNYNMIQAMGCHYWDYNSRRCWLPFLALGEASCCFVSNPMAGNDVPTNS